MKLSLRLSFHNLRFNFLIIIVHVIAKHNKNFHRESCKILIRLETLYFYFVTFSKEANFYFFVIYVGRKLFSPVK